MTRIHGFLLLIFSFSICQASIFHPISDNHRSAALQLFSSTDGSYESLEDTYEVLRTFQILGVEKDAGLSSPTCQLIVKNLQSSSSSLKDLFDALRVNSILKCEIDGGTFEGIISKLQASVNDASSLFDYYYSIGSLVLLKDKLSESNVLLAEADGIFRSIKALSQSDGRWRHSSNGAESSVYAAGLALEALAGVVSLSSSGIDQSLIGTVKNDIVKLFDSLKQYDDGALYFDEKLVDAREDQGPLSSSSSVVRGVVAFSEVTSGKLNLPGDKLLGLAKFFLGIGVPVSSKDLFNQIDSLYYLENNRISVPLILSLSATVLSLTNKDQLKVKVTTALGSDAPPVTVKLVQASFSSSKATPLVESQELKFIPESRDYSLDVLSMGFDVGKYNFAFRVLPHDPEHKKIYATGGQIQVPILVSGFVKIDNAGVAVLDSDLQSTETKQTLDLSEETSLSLSATHLQKLQLSFQLTTARGYSFKPHQVFLKLTHETKVEHIFIVGNSGSQFEITLDFLRLVDQLYYLSGRYDIELTVGDAAMENSFLRALGHIELDLPEAPEKATKPPPQPVDPNSRYGPKPEISHIFRSPEKRPAQDLSFGFLVITILPLFGFLIGLIRLGVNLKNFPSASAPATFATLFHAGIAAVLSLYLLFWLKLDLFTTLKMVGFVGVFLLFVGHKTLAHLASTSDKLKSA